jgi:FkbM family methyltransferase
MDHYLTAPYRNHTIKFIASGIPAHEPKYYFEVERELIEKHWLVKKDEVVIDAGACYGSWTIPALLEGAHVAAYEPHPTLYNILLRNLYLNDLKNTIAVNKPLWSSVGHTMTLPIYDLSMMLNERSKTQPSVIVTTETLDNDFKYDRLDWIKIDVEGAEIEILKGARNLIEKFNPKIIVEWHADRNKDPDMNYLKDWARVEKLDPGHWLIQLH